jgi:hypothetical protein
MYETALLEDARAEIARIGACEIVVGIHSYRNAKSIGAVVNSAKQALAQYYPTRRSLLVNVDNNSSDGTAAAFLRQRIAPDVFRFSTGYLGLTGAGSAVRAIFEVAARLKAEVCVVLDAALTDVRPPDIRAMIDPVLANRAHLVLPMHQWDQVDAAFEDLLVRPMVRLMYGRAVRRPLSGDWALSGRLALAYSEQDVWETDAARSGLDVWLLVSAIAGNIPVLQVPSCRKATTLAFGTTAYDQRFSHTVSTLLRHLGAHQRLWRNVYAVENVATTGAPPPVLPAAQQPTEQFWRAFLHGVRGWRRLYRRVLTPEDIDALLEMARGNVDDLVFPDDLWARIVVDFGVCFNKAELDPEKVASSLATPFFARALALWRDLEREGMDSYDAHVERQCQAFEGQRLYLLNRWDSYVAWVPDAPPR